MIRILLAIAPMLLRFLVTLIAQDERIRRMGPRALLLLIPVAAVGVVYFFTRSLVASLATGGFGDSWSCGCLSPSYAGSNAAAGRMMRYV